MVKESGECRESLRERSDGAQKCAIGGLRERRAGSRLTRVWITLFHSDDCWKLSMSCECAWILWSDSTGEKRQVEDIGGRAEPNS